MPIQFRQFRALLKYFQFAPGRPAIAYGLRGALGLCVPIVVGQIAGHSDWGMIAALVALVEIQTDGGGAYRQKAKIMLAATLGIALVMVLTAFAGDISWLTVLVTFLWVFGAGLAGLYGNTATTVGFATSIILVISIVLPIPPTALQRFLLCLVGGTWAMTLSLGLWGLYPYRPVLRSVGDCYLALTLLVEFVAGMACKSEQRRHWLTGVAQAQDAVTDKIESARTMWGAVRTARQGASRRGLQLLVLLQDAGQITNSVVALAEMIAVVADHPRFEQVQTELQQAIRQVAIASGMLAGAITQGGHRVALTELEQAIAALEAKQRSLQTQLIDQTEGYYGLVNVRKIINSLKALAEQIHADAEMVEQMREGDRLGPAQSEITEVMAWNPSAVLQTLRDNLTFQSLGFRHALRLGLTTAIALLLASLSHMPKGNWIALTALITLKPSFGGTSTTAVQRVGGTVLGGIIAIGLSALVHDHWLRLAALFLLALTAISLKPLNYGVFVILLTPLVVLITNFTTTGNWEISAVRILDTLIGGALALLGGYLLFPNWERQRLPNQLAKTLRVNITYFRRVMVAYLDVTQNTYSIQEIARQAALENANAAAAAQRLLSEPRHVRGAVEPMMTLIFYIRSFSNSITTLTEHLQEFSGEHPLPELEALVDVIAHVLENLAAVLQQEASLQPLPDLKPYLEAVQSQIEPLSAIGQTESITARSRTTTTLQTVREHTLVSTELDRIVKAVAIMHDAMVRLQRDFDRKRGNG